MLSGLYEKLSRVIIKMKKPIFIILGLIVLAIASPFLWIIFFTCAGDMACHTAESFPPRCDEKGAIFLLLKNKDMFFREYPIPDGAFYYLLPVETEDVKGYGAMMPVEIADYGSINLEEFVGKTVCVEGKFRFGIPTFFAEVKDYPEGIGNFEGLVVDIKEIQVR